MYLQTVMLLLRAEGLHSCPQMSWSQVRKTVDEIVSPDELMLFCGMSIGYEDPTVDFVHNERARGSHGGMVTSAADWQGRHRYERRGGMSSQGRGNACWPGANRETPRV